MKKHKTTEKNIADLIQSKNPFTLKTFKTMLICFYVYDNIFNTSHVNNLKAVYVKNAEDSVTKLARITHNDNRTLTRYRGSYLKCFELCEFAIKYFDEIFNFLK